MTKRPFSDFSKGDIVKYTDKHGELFGIVREVGLNLMQEPVIMLDILIGNIEESRLNRWNDRVAIINEQRIAGLELIGRNAYELGKILYGHT
jgi:hypothetical protein